MVLMRVISNVVVDYDKVTHSHHTSSFWQQMSLLGLFKVPLMEIHTTNGSAEPGITSLQLSMTHSSFPGIQHPRWISRFFSTVTNCCQDYQSILINLLSIRWAWMWKGHKMLLIIYVILPSPQWVINRIDHERRALFWAGNREVSGDQVFC